MTNLKKKTEKTLKIMAASGPEAVFFLPLISSDFNLEKYTEMIFKFEKIIQ